MEEVKGWRDTRVHLLSVGIWPLVEQMLGKMLPWHHGGAPMDSKGTDFPPPSETPVGTFSKHNATPEIEHLGDFILLFLSFFLFAAQDY